MMSLTKTESYKENDCFVLMKWNLEKNFCGLFEEISLYSYVFKILKFIYKILIIYYNFVSVS